MIFLLLLLSMYNRFLETCWLSPFADKARFFSWNCSFYGPSWLRLKAPSYPRSFVPRWMFWWVNLLVQVWVPDTFFRNEREGRFHNLLQPNLYLRIFPNGDILHSIRVGRLRIIYKIITHLRMIPFWLDLDNNVRIWPFSCRLDFSKSLINFQKN